MIAQPLDESVSYLSGYIISDEFTKIKENNSDLAAIDSLYAEALRFNEGDVSEALLTVTFAALAFEELPIRVPIINEVIDLPLARVDNKLFSQKIGALPKNLFFNSPKSKFGDKDKITHFFGSAYLAHSVTIFNLSKFMGIFIELFEATFKVEGHMDFRDMQINNLGEFYGVSLHKNSKLMPSHALQYYNLFYFRITN